MFVFGTDTICWLFFAYNVVKTIIHNFIFDGLYHPFMVNLGMVYLCFNHIIPYLIPTRHSNSKDGRNDVICDRELNSFQ